MSTSKPNKDAIGKGLRSLLQGIDSDMKNNSGTLKPTVVEAATGMHRIPVADIEPNPKQPRHDFDQQALEELAASIKEHDLVQPITVSKMAGGKYRLVSGERRWRAAKLAGLIDVPAYIRQANDQQLLELALLENLQRENLNAVEIALSYQRMIDELDYTQEQVAESMGKERSTVTNYIRLLKLPPDIQLAVRQGTLSMGHARALISIETVDRQLYVYRQIVEKNLSVRQTEELVTAVKKESQGAAKPAAKNSLPPAYKKIEDNLTSHFSTRVKLNHNKKGHGSITIEYYSLDELNKFLDKVGVTAN
jgi:ParB family chromosome partitioning protein